MAVLDSLEDPKTAELLLNGCVGVLPTDTVYGLVCRAGDEAAVARLYALKKREAKPGTLIAADIGQLANLGIKARYLKPVTHYWPNPISIIIPTAGLEYIHQGVGSLAVRIPADQPLQTLLARTGPLLTSSANQPGEPEPADIAGAKEYFGDSIDFYVDGGDMSGRKPSTLIRIVDDAVEVLRQGAVTVNENGEIQS